MTPEWFTNQHRTLTATILFQTKQHAQPSDLHPTNIQRNVCLKLCIDFYITRSQTLKEQFQFYKFLNKSTRIRKLLSTGIVIALTVW